MRFLFIALASGNQYYNSEGSKGSQRGSQLTIWESDGITEVHSNRYHHSNRYQKSYNDNVVLGTAGLILGNTYYISVSSYI